MPRKVVNPGTKAERYCEYVPATREMVKRIYPPHNTEVSAKFVAFHVKQDPVIRQQFTPHENSDQALRSVISANLRQLGGQKRNDGNRKSSPYHLPKPVKEL
jgi:hypothetical protein